MVACALVLSTPAQARCDKSTVEEVQYLLPYAATNFAAIRGAVRTSSPPFQYDFSAAASAYCMNEYGILEDIPADGQYPEFWQVRLSGDKTGSGDDVAISLIKTYSPIFKTAGYQDKPYIQNRDDPNTYKMWWDGPSNTWVVIKTYIDDLDPKKTGRIGYEIDVGHDVK